MKKLVVLFVSNLLIAGLFCASFVGAQDGIRPPTSPYRNPSCDPRAGSCGRKSAPPMPYGPNYQKETREKGGYKNKERGNSDQYPYQSTAPRYYKGTREEGGVGERKRYY